MNDDDVRNSECIEEDAIKKLTVAQQDFLFRNSNFVASEQVKFRFSQAGDTGGKMEHTMDLNDSGNRVSNGNLLLETVDDKNNRVSF